MSFPSIVQFRHVVQTVRFRARYVGRDEEGNPVYDETRALPTLRVTGTVKLHGTNAGVLLRNGDLVAMSRHQDISPTADNAGFAKFVADNDSAFRSLFDGFGDDVVIRGEWCGRGINKGCAVHELDKMFVIFAVSRGEGDERVWLDIGELSDLACEDARIFNIVNFACYELEIDFANPASARDQLEAITNAVEAECPVGKAFGVSGVGEGVVWVIRDESYEGSSFWFKVKGDKHKVTKTKRVVEVDPERASTVLEFVDATVSEQRLLQGLAVLETNGVVVDQKATGSFLKWVFADIIKEESDRLEASGLSKKDVSAAVSRRAKEFWFEHLDALVGL